MGLLARFEHLAQRKLKESLAWLYTLKALSEKKQLLAVTSVFSTLNWQQEDAMPPPQLLARWTPIQLACRGLLQAGAIHLLKSHHAATLRGL